MIFGSTKSKLDHIIENGFRRIDEAVEGVIAKYPVEEEEDTYLLSLAGKGILRSGACTEAVAMAAGSAARDYMISMNEGQRHTNEALAPLVDDLMKQAQREYNYRVSALAERTALAPKSDYKCFIPLSNNSDTIQIIRHQDMT